MQLFKGYFRPIFASLVIFTSLSSYIFLRRGYYDLYIANKVVAGTGLILLGLVLVIGVLVRAYTLFDSWLKYRKQFGILTFIYSFLHVVISYFLLPEDFPPTRYTFTNLPFVFGLIATAILIILIIFSFEAFISKVDRKQWWGLQNWGVRIVGVLVLLHVVVMKWSGWLKWLESGGTPDLLRPFLPPASLLVTVIFVAVVLIRVAESVIKSRVQWFTTSIFVFLVLMLGSLIVWGTYVTPTKPLTWEVCTKMHGSMLQTSYPGVCVTADGRSITQPLTEEEREQLNPPTPAPTSQDYYGSSTNASCSTDSDCIVSGCNSEICQGKDEESMFSICVFPEKPTPEQVGLTCGCANSQCQWK